MKTFPRIRLACLTLLVFISAIAAVASPVGPFALPGQEGATATASPSPTEFETKPITEWAGERFVFLGRDPSLRKYGYQLIYPADRTIGTLPYDGYVGKVVRVTGVVPSSTRVSGSYNVEMVVEETGERLRALASGGTVRGLGPVADVERARALYVGKTLWREAGSMQTVDERSGKTSFIGVGPFDSLKVVAVTAGWDDSAPVRIVVRTPAGEEGFVDVNFSGTNVAGILRNHHRFDKEFQLVAPARESNAEAARSYKPTSEVLARAASGKDVLGWQQGWWGMTADELLQTFGSQLQKLPKRDLYRGTYAEYVIPNYRVDNDPYTVIFQMDNRTNRLAQVIVRSEEYPKESPHPSAFDRLEALLSQKYGSVRYRKDDDEGRFVRRERQWVFPTTTIDLSYSFMQGISNGVTIRYYPTASSDANKL
ncbi:MAG TPA: hypothetical protein VF297_31955 [Pyrinomonadaceae bacterium]